MLLLYNNIDFSQNTNKDANNIVSIIKFNEYLKKNKEGYTCKYYLYLIDIRRKNNQKQDLSSYRFTR